MLERNSTYLSPYIILQKGELKISGKLWMENPQEYFEEIFLFTRTDSSAFFSVILDIEHMSSSSVKQLLEYFKLLEYMKASGRFKNVSIIWNVPHDDLELIELINDLASISELEIDIIKIKDSNYTL
jgi:hypothetical protein